MQKKIIDTSSNISVGGSAQRFWGSKGVARSDKYNDGKNSVDSSVNPLDLLKQYQIKGFEFGNWLNNNDRYDFLLATEKSLSDLSKILGSKNIGLDSNIGLAFGARGIPSAKAHFEPDTFMINLTKEKGFNSLAHEYGHALDYFFGTYIDQNKNHRSLSGGHFTARQLKDNTGGRLRSMMNIVLQKAIFDEKGEVSASYKRLTQKAGLGDYWLRRCEMFARIFEQHIMSKLYSIKTVNTFLAKDKLKYEGWAYLMEADYKRVAPYLNQLLKEMSFYMNNKAPKRKALLESKTVVRKKETREVKISPAIPKEFKTIYNQVVKTEKGISELDVHLMVLFLRDIPNTSFSIDKQNLVKAFKGLELKNLVKEIKAERSNYKTFVKTPKGKKIVELADKLIISSTKPKKITVKAKVANKGVSVSIDSAIKDVLKLGKYSRLKPMEAAVLFSSYKKGSLNFDEKTLKGAILNSVEKKGFVNLSWADDKYRFSTLGADFIKAVNKQLEYLKGKRYGYNIF